MGFLGSHFTCVEGRGVEIADRLECRCCSVAFEGGSYDSAVL